MQHPLQNMQEAVVLPAYFFAFGRVMEREGGSWPPLLHTSRFTIAGRVLAPATAPILSSAQNKKFLPEQELFYAS